MIKDSCFQRFPYPIRILRDVFILHLIFDISIPKIILKNHYIFDTSVKIRDKSLT